eukprot:141477_1
MSEEKMQETGPRLRLTLPPESSLTLGEVENNLIYIEEKQSSEDEARIIHSFVERKGLLFKWIRIPIQYFERYSSSKLIESNSNLITNNTFVQDNVMEALTKCTAQLRKIWNLASPFNDKVTSNHLLFKHNPSITQQIHSDYSMSSHASFNANSIIKFDYHPLHRQIIVAFKNGIVFFDMKRNAWIPRVLHNENQVNITDFAFSDSGLLLAVTC